MPETQPDRIETDIGARLGRVAAGAGALFSGPPVLAAIRARLERVDPGSVPWLDIRILTATALDGAAPAAPEETLWEAAPGPLAAAIDQAFFRGDMTRAGLRRRGLPPPGRAIETGRIGLAALTAHQRLTAITSLETGPRPPAGAKDR